MDEQSTSNTASTLQWPDYVVIGIMLLISAGIGVYYRFTGGRQRTAEEYFSANRSMGVAPLAIALTVSFVSAITLLGISAETYAHGMPVVLFYTGSITATPIIIYFYLPVFAELQVMSVYEYLERRFGAETRLFASTANFLQLMFYTGVVLFAPSLALEATTGLSGDLSVLLVGIICTFYSTIGGIKAVLITDVVQGVLMFVAVACILGVGASVLDGGLSNVWSISQQGGRTSFNFSFDPTERYTFWSILFGSTTLFLSLYAVNQVQVQRLLTARNLKASQYALLLSGPLTLALGALTTYSGLMLYTIYKDCDPITSGTLSSFDQMMPYFAAQELSQFPGLTGLFISGILSASLSTISAMLNSLAAVELEDYVKPVYKKIGVEFPTEKATLIGKMLGIVNGFFCLALAFLAKLMGGLVETAVGISGVIGGPILGLFTLGMFVENANQKGAIVGMVISMTLGLWAVLGYPKPDAPNLPFSVEGCDNATLLMNHVNLTPIESEATSYFYLYRISYLWYAPMGFAITMIVGYLASLAANRIFQKDTREPDPSLFIPYLASRIRRRRETAGKTTSSQVFMLDRIIS